MSCLKCFSTFSPAWYWEEFVKRLYILSKSIRLCVTLTEQKEAILHAPELHEQGNKCFAICELLFRYRQVLFSPNSEF